MISLVFLQWAGALERGEAGIQDGCKEGTSGICVLEEGLY